MKKIFIIALITSFSVLANVAYSKIPIKGESIKRIDSAQTNFVHKNSSNLRVERYCIDGLEFIIAAHYGTDGFEVTQVLDTNGKPKTCN